MGSIAQFNLLKPDPVVIRLIDKYKTNAVTVQQGDEVALRRMAEGYGFLAGERELGLPYRGRPMSQQESLFVESLASGMARALAQFAAKAALPSSSRATPPRAASPAPVKRSALSAGPERLNVAVGDGPVYKEKHYSITELVELWAPRCRNTIRKLVMFEPGVVQIPGRTRKRTTYLVPESVVQRIYTRLSN
jgi:hypothetical protein